MADGDPVRVSILAIGYTGGHRVAYLLLAFALVLFGLAAFDVVAPDSGGWASVGLWAGAGVIFLVTADVSGLGYSLVRAAPAELSDAGFGAPFFRFRDFRTGRDPVVLRSRILRLPVARATAPNRVDWSALVVRAGVYAGAPYLELWPLRGAPFRSLISGVRSTLPAEALATVTARVLAASGDFHAVDELLTPVGRSAERPCPHSFRSDPRFGRCLAPPPSERAARDWFRETAPRDARFATTALVDGAPIGGDTP